MSDTAVANPAVADVVAGTRRLANLFVQDLSAMDDAMLASCPGGKARCAYDLVYEVVSLNRQVAAYAARKDFDYPKHDGWLKAPESYQGKDATIKDFQDSVDEVTSSLEGASPERLDEIVESPLGPMPLMQFAKIVPLHIMYHSGQLNYIQTLHGDDQLHWA